MAPETFTSPHTNNNSNDLWSLAITLFFLIIGDKPWAQATQGFHDWDRDYEEFYHDSSSLERRFPISKQVNAFFGKALDSQIERRLSLEEMKGEVLGVKSYWLSSAELENASTELVDYAVLIGLPLDDEADSVEWEGTTAVDSSSDDDVPNRLGLDSSESHVSYEKQMDKGKGKMKALEPTKDSETDSPPRKGRRKGKGKGELKGGKKVRAVTSGTKGFIDETIDAGAGAGAGSDPSNEVTSELTGRSLSNTPFDTSTSPPPYSSEYTPPPLTPEPRSLPPYSRRPIPQSPISPLPDRLALLT